MRITGVTGVTGCMLTELWWDYAILQIGRRKKVPQLPSRISVHHFFMFFDHLLHLSFAVPQKKQQQMKPAHEKESRLSVI